MTDGEPAGRHVVITGAAAGIGRAVTEHLVSRGVQVYAIDRDAAGLAGLNGVARSYVADLADRDQLHRLIEQLLTALPRLDGLVNNAGLTLRWDLSELTEERLYSCLDINLSAPIQLIRGLVGPLAATGGAVVNMASIHAFTTGPTNTAYSASKAGVAAITRALAVELGPRGIRVNAIAPGYIDTGYVAGYPPGVATAISRQHPLQRIGEPADVVGATAFLLSDAARFITGVVLPVDGGLSARLSAMVSDWTPVGPAA